MPRKRVVGDPGVVIAYLRVSTDEQAASGAGLAAQAAAIEAEVKHRDWQLLRSYTDAGVSGKTVVGRPQLHAAMDAIEAGEAGTLMVAKLDRLSRSLLDFAGLMARAQEQGWNLVALDLGIDLSTPAGEFLASVMASAAQWERRIIGQRTKDALAARRAAGVRLGRPVIVAPEVVERIVEARAAGTTYEAIAQSLDDDGVATAHGGRWQRATVRKIALRGAVPPVSAHG